MDNLVKYGNVFWRTFFNVVYRWICLFSCAEPNANELEQRVLALTLGSAHEKNHVFVLITSLPPWFNANDS